MGACPRHPAGRRVQYEYAASGLRLDDYQTIVGSVPGSAEMASAARAFTWEMLFRLRRSGSSSGSGLGAGNV